jgi:hypothetical protein
LRTDFAYEKEAEEEEEMFSEFHNEYFKER